jgi:dihydrofolate reductase
MGKLIVFTWVTLDGIFDADTMQEWFFPFSSIAKDECIRKNILESEALLVGRKTYEMLASYWPHQSTDENGPANKINSMKKFVVSSKLQKADWQNSTIIDNNVIEEVKKLKRQEGEIQIPGSATLVKLLMKENLIDEFRLLVHPIMMGEGKRFFKDEMKTTGMKLVKTQNFDKGVLLLCYQTGNGIL